ncbi:MULTISPECIES: hypothetical protein [Amycolatopsis]|uniref:hypothetical protein n=1 Tax=Amycolatopsis TaxID=1813 RepID=UPI00174A6CC1|nr:hypothetical protein [Amycolatopsis bullii]
MLVEHRTFLLLDPHLRTRQDPGDPPHHLATATPGALWLHSGGTDHYAHVRVELWTTPPHAAVPGDAHARTTLVVAGNKLCLATTINGPVLHLPASDNPDITAPTIRYLRLPHPGHYLADITVRGHADAAELPEANWQHHVENWTIRLISN